MILSRKYLKSLIAQGKAGYPYGSSAKECLTTTNSIGVCYVIVNRYDLQRVDHYQALPIDCK